MNGSAPLRLNAPLSLLATCIGNTIQETATFRYQLEKEYFSEKIAEMIYPKENSSEFLKLAEQKAEYKKLTNLKQGKIDFKNA